MAPNLSREDGSQTARSAHWRCDKRIDTDRLPEHYERDGGAVAERDTAPDAQRQSGHEDPEFVEALARGLQLLESFTALSPSIGLSELSRRSGLGKRTTYRLAKTLQTLGYLAQDPSTKMYSPSLRVLDLGFTVLESLELRHRARPFLDELSRRTHEFVSLGVLDGMQIVMVDTLKPAGITVGVQTYVGWRDPAHASSHGKVLLAWLSDEALKVLYPEEALEARTERSITSLSRLKAELAQVRARGFAINDEESSKGVRSVAAPVRDRTGKVVGSVNLAVPTARASRKRLESEYAQLVLECTRNLSRALGHRDGVPDNS
jgi:IclR family transcriptional regulator, pca regulon regulatory protein